LKTLLSSNDVKVFCKGIIDNDFPTYDIGDILNIERNERREIFGNTLYDGWIERLNDYEGVEKWESGNNYSEGELKGLNGIIWRSKIANNRNEPGVGDSWEKAPKFDNEELEILWCSFLGLYLSLRVLDVILVDVKEKITGHGLIEVQGQTFKPVKENGELSKRRNIRNRMNIVFQNLKEYIKENKLGSLSGEKISESKENQIDKIYNRDGGILEKNDGSPVDYNEGGRNRWNNSVYKVG
jgi:hypothetical protein